jgi:hypothetical protein
MTLEDSHTGALEITRKVAKTSNLPYSSLMTKDLPWGCLKIRERNLNSGYLIANNNLYFDLRVNQNPYQSLNQFFRYYREQL